MFVTHLRCMATVTVAMLTALAAPAVETQAADLFTSVATSPSAISLDANALRSRVVTIDLEQLARAQQAAVTDSSAPGTTLTFNLFDDTVITGTVEWTEPTFSGGYSVAGRLVGDALGTMTLVVNDEWVAGTVRTREGLYRIRSVGNGLATISEVEEPLAEEEGGEQHFETDHQHFETDHQH